MSTKDFSLWTMIVMAACLLTWLLAGTDDRMSALTPAQQREIISRWQQPTMLEINAGLSQPLWVGRMEVKR